MGKRMPLPNETLMIEWKRDSYILSTDRTRLDIDVICHFLARESYWAKDMPAENVLRAINGSMTLGIYHEGKQIGFARVVTDYARIAYLMDVFIDQTHRGRGLGTWLATVVRSHPDLATVSRWLLTTKDAHGVYARAGWQPVSQPAWLMEACGSPALDGTQMVATPIEDKGLQP